MPAITYSKHKKKRSPFGKRVTRNSAPTQNQTIHSMQQEKIFDGIRGLAFLLVLLMHGFSIGLDGAAVYLQGCGKYGVWLFFVLSSFLLSTNYVLPDKSKFDYAVGRVIRIVPLYLVACAVYSAFGLAEIKPGEWLALALVQYGPLHLWTIPVEFYFYLFLIALWLIPNTPARDLVFFMSSALALYALAATAKDPNTTNTLWYLPSFFVGYVLARAWPQIPEIRHGSIFSVAIIILFVIAAPGTLYLAFGIAPSPYLMNMYTPLSLAWGIFIICICKAPRNLMHRALSGPFFCLLGKISYSGYLFHWVVMVKTRALLGSGPTTSLLSIALSLGVAIVAFTLLEHPVHKTRKFLHHKAGRLALNNMGGRY